jgi:hypothetical protein
MQLYSHLVIAQKMLSYLCPDDLPEYYWGAVAADVRYFAGMRRITTHPPAEEVRGWQAEFPDLNSFVLGYRVHTLADERDAVGCLYDFIPWRAVRRSLPRSWATYIWEAVCIERCRFDGRISGAYNLLLEKLGVPRTAVSAYAEAVTRYAADPSFELVMKLLSEMDWMGSPRLRRYISLAGWLKRNPRVLRVLLMAIDEHDITRRVVSDLTAHF